ncbi:MAG: membrane protein insertase YidC [Bacteroidetes bacterium 4572_112]|nr:MAG: membrane protein insertase YidC [Bacteroidetes bacterium 4572_112]
MNKDTILGFFFIFLILVGYSWYVAPSEEDIAQQKVEMARQDSLNEVRKEQSRIAETERKMMKAADDVGNQQSTESNNAVVSDSMLNDMQLQKFGGFAAMSHGEEKEITIENDKIKIRVSTKGGNITYAELKEYHTYDTMPLVLFDKNTASISYLLNDKRVESKSLYFEPIAKSDSRVEDSIYVHEGETYSFAMRIYPNDNNGKVLKDKYLEFAYTITGDDYMIDYNLNMQGMSDFVAPGLNDIPLYLNMDMLSMEKDPKQEAKQTAIFYRYSGDDESVDELSLTSMDEEKEDLSTKVKWISFKQQFFSFVIIADESFAKAEIVQEGNEESANSRFLKNMKADISVPLSNNSEFQSVAMHMYMGPNKYSELKKYELDLERMVPLGWGFFLLHWINRVVVIPVFHALSGFGWNYGIIILVLTLLLKVVLFPIAYKTYMSSAKMRVLKPEIDELAKKFPKKEDSVKKQQATMSLYKKAGVNPMAGCVPMLLQMPILFALFRFFPAAIELRQQSFLWADDLSAYDSIYSWTQQIPLLSTFYGNHISLFTLLMTVSTILYTRMNNQMMASNQQMPGMKTMMYLMPIMFLGFFNNYASGLSYYYFLANIITFSQMYLMRRFVDEDAIRAKLEANKKKPVKKSKFQARLEEMAKQKGVKK